MLLQSLLLISTLLVLGGAILTSTLVSAKVAFHEQLTRASDTAMADATADFVEWARYNIRTNGIDELPVWSATPHQEPIKQMCSGVASALVATGLPHCTLFRIIKWNVTGHTQGSGALMAPSLPSEATKLAIAQDEQRISATINTTITDSSGTTIFANHSAEITARIFHSFPYASITGTKDVSSERGDIYKTEGDTGGHQEQVHGSQFVSSLSPETPAAYTTTTIRTTTDCENTANNSFTDPTLDDNSVSFVMLRPYGNLIWSYEVPCRSSIPVNLNSAPAGYEPHYGNAYNSGSTIDSSWSKGDDSDTPFAL